MEKPINPTLQKVILLTGAILLILFIFYTKNKDKSDLILNGLSENSPYLLIKGKNIDGEVVQQGVLGKFYPCLKISRSLHDKQLSGGSRRYVLYLSESTHMNLSTAEGVVYVYLIRDKAYDSSPFPRTSNCKLSLLNITSTKVK